MGDRNGGSPLHAQRALFNERGFVLFLGSRLCTGIATTLMRAAFAWHVYELSGSATMLGLIGVVQFIPAVTLTLLGGAVADAYDRRRILLGVQFVPMACGAVLCAATLGGWVGLPLLFALIAVMSTANAFQTPAGASLLPLLVPRELFARAVAVQSMTRLAAFMTGPIVMGVASKYGGIGTAYGVQALLLAGSITALALVRPRHQQTERRNVSWHSVAEGVRYVWQNKAVLGCMTLDLFAVVFGTAVMLLPIFAKDILGVGELGYGLLASSLEIGSVLSSLALVFMPTVHRPGRALLVAVGAFGVCTVLFGLSQSFVLSFLAHVLVGMADGVSVVMRGTIVQLSTPDALRGRVSAVNMVFIQASNQLGAARAGFLAQAIGAPLTVVVGGVISLAVVGVVRVAMPALGQYRTE